MQWLNTKATISTMSFFDSAANIDARIKNSLVKRLQAFAGCLSDPHTTATGKMAVAFEMDAIETRLICEFGMDWNEVESVTYTNA